MIKECLQCGSTENLVPLSEIDKYACMDCLEEVGRQQERIKNHIIEVFTKENDISIVDFQDKLADIIEIIIYAANVGKMDTIDVLLTSLKAINISFSLDNGILVEEFQEKIQNFLDNSDYL